MHFCKNLDNLANAFYTFGRKKYKIAIKEPGMKSSIKEAILETAWEMFRRHGIGRTSIDDVARTAMVAKATIYNYFGSKDQVYKEALDRKIGFMTEQLNHAVSSLPSALEKLRAFIEASLEMLQEEAFLFADEHGQSRRFVAKLADARGHFLASREKLLKGILEQGANEGVFPAQNITQVSRFIEYLLRGFAPTADRAGNSVSFPADIHSEAASLFDMLCHGLLSREGRI
jgi:AcrR family transcriptional regulator